jgi:hypothetical protein
MRSCVLPDDCSPEDLPPRLGSCIEDVSEDQFLHSARFLQMMLDCKLCNVHHACFAHSAFLMFKLKADVCWIRQLKSLLVQYLVMHREDEIRLIVYSFA